MTALGVWAAALLLLAGLPRLVRGSAAQRALAAGLTSSALVLVLELDPVEAVLAGVGLVSAGTLVQCLAITAAAASAFGLARRVAPAPLLPRVRPPVVGAVLALLQLALFAVAGVGRELPADGSLFLDHLDRPAVVGLWLVTVVGPAAAGAVLLPVLWRHGPWLAPLRSRLAVAATITGLVLVGSAGLVMGLGLVHAAAGRPDTGALLAMVAPVSAVGLAVIACGVLAGRVADAAPVRWVGAHLALHRLGPLARELVAAAPEWACSTVPDRRLARDPVGQLYRRVIAIRDTSWTLFGPVDDADVVRSAVRFARVRVAGETAVAVLAEACWLRYAVAARTCADDVPPSGAADFPERVLEPPGSLREEAAFLVGVARMWRDPLVDEFLAGCPPPRCPPARCGAGPTTAARSGG